MKTIFRIALLFLLAGKSIAQTTTYQENFENYQGFGDNLTGGWSSSNFGFKVYLRNMPGSVSNKLCEVPLTANHRTDSLITPELTLVTGWAQLNFQSRIVDSYIGNTASFSHIPASGDNLKAFLSVDGSSFSQVLDLLPSYPVSSQGLNFTNFSIPISGTAGSTAKVKFVASSAGSEWYPSFDNFALVNNSDPTAVHRTRKSDPGIQLIPNPASQRITILSAGFGSTASVEIFNILGNLVFSSAMNGGKCITDISNFRPGVYLVKVSEGSKSAMERLIVKQ